MTVAIAWYDSHLPAGSYAPSGGKYYAESDHGAFYDVTHLDAFGHAYGQSARTGAIVRITRTGRVVKGGRVRARLEFPSATLYRSQLDFRHAEHVGGWVPAELFGF